MDFNRVWYEVVESEADINELKEKASQATAKQMCKEFSVSEYKLRQVLKMYDIKPLVPERASQRDYIAHWASTFNGGKLRYVYYDMLKRCHDTNNKGYEQYGAKGIVVCKEWREDCRSFYKWAKENGYDKGLTIDRIDNSKGYSPDNCRWTTWKVQTVNRSCTRWVIFNGERKTLKEWSTVLGMDYQLLADRIYRLGWTVDRAFTTK